MNAQALHDLKAALTARAAEVAVYCCRDPNRAMSTPRELRFGRKGSLSVEIAGDRAGVWFDHETGEGGDLLALIQHVTGCGFCEALDEAQKFVGVAAEPVLRPTRPSVAQHMPTDAEGTARALRLWGEAGSPTATLVAPYLAGRGLVLPPEAANTAIRFHPRCPFGPGVTTPAMIALIRDVHTNQPLAIHRTALTLEGRKAKIDGKDRMMLGPAGGGLVKLSPDESVETVVAIGEGIESVLSVRLIPGCESLPIWAALSKGGVAAFPLLAGVEVLWIAVDHDEPGLGAVEAVAARWTQAGRDVEIIMPKRERDDLNDLAQRRMTRTNVNRPAQDAGQPPGASDDGPKTDQRRTRHG